MNDHSYSHKNIRTVLSQSIIFLLSRYIRILFDLIHGIVIAKFLGPALFGLRNVLLLMLKYETSSDLGTYNAMVREVPYYRGSEKREKASRIMTSVFSVNMLYAMIAGLIFIFVSLYMRSIGMEAEYGDIVFFFGLFIIANKAKHYYSYKFIIDKKIILLSRLDIFSGINSVIICIPLVYYFSLRGLFVGLLIVDLVHIGLILIIEKPRHSMSISFPTIRELIKIGFPMTITLLSVTLLTSTDRIMVITMLSEEDLGYYGIAAIIIYIVYSVPEIIHSIFSPRFMEKLGQTKDPQQIKNYFIEPTVLIAYFIPYLLSAFYFSIHMPINYFLVKFVPSIQVVKILVPGLFFGAVSTLPLFICYALNTQIRIIFIAVPMILLNATLNYFFILTGWGINGVALGTDISNFVFCSLMIWYTLRQFSPSAGEHIRFFTLIYAPFLYALILLLAIDDFLSLSTHDFWGDIRDVSFKIVVFSLLFSFIFVIVKSHPVFVKLIGGLTSRYASGNQRG